MGPDRAQEMARAMQMHLAERKAQAGTLANQGGALVEAGMMGLGEAYDGLSLPQRPIDAILAGGPQPGGEAMQQEMLIARNPGLGMTAAPTMGQTPQELGIGPSPEWMAKADASERRIDTQIDERAFQRAMVNARRKLLKQQYSAEWGSPEAGAERRRLAADHYAKRNAS